MHLLLTKACLIVDGRRGKTGVGVPSAVGLLTVYRKNSKVLIRSLEARKNKETLKIILNILLRNLNFKIPVGK